MGLGRIKRCEWDFCQEAAYLIGHCKRQATAMLILKQGVLCKEATGEKLYPVKLSCKPC
jgi:hypothetical protein